MTTTNQNTLKYLELSYLELMSDGDPDMKLTMVEMLIEELPVELAKMKTHLENLEWDQLGDVSHKMKSTLAFVGNDSLTNANKDIELIAKSGGSPEISKLLAAMEEIFPHVMNELETVKGQIS